MNFAVVKISGKQYLVSEGDKIVVSGQLGQQNSLVPLTEALLVGTDNTLQIGTPKVSAIELNAKIISVGKGEKVRVSKFKAKSRYRRVMGFRPQITTLQIVQIGSAKKAEENPDQTKRPKVKKSLKK